jgi:hypothetical protein
MKDNEKIEVKGETAKTVQVIQPLTKTDAVPIVPTVQPLPSPHGLRRPLLGTAGCPE